MKQGIVLATGDKREEWVENFLAHLPEQNQFPLHVVHQNHFELGAIRMVLETTDLDEFIFLHDTCEVKSAELYEFCFVKNRGRSVSFSDHPSVIGMFLGKYRREVLDQLPVWIPASKHEAVDAEITWPRLHAEVERPVMIPYPLHDGRNFVTKCGRLNMKLENDWLVKYKGTWSRAML